MEKSDNFWIGFLIGSVVPVLGYVLIGEIFSLLTSSGAIDEITMSSGGQRSRTVLLLSIAANIIPAQYWSKRRSHFAIKGLVTATLIYAGFWLYKFYPILMHNF